MTEIRAWNHVIENHFRFLPWIEIPVCGHSLCFVPLFSSHYRSAVDTKSPWRRPQHVLKTREGKSGKTVWPQAIDRLIAQGVYSHHRFRRIITCERGHNTVTESQAPFPPSHRSCPREQLWVTVTNQYMGVPNVGGIVGYSKIC